MAVWVSPYSNSCLLASAKKGVSVVTSPKTEPDVAGVRPEKEQKQMMDYETLAKMPLESLLYYVLVGDGSKRSEAASG